MEKLPITSEVVYSKTLLDDLQRAIDENNQICEDYSRNKLQLKNLEKALKPLLEIREEALSLPDIDIENLSPGETIKQVKLDIRGEKLIFECIELQQEFVKKAYEY